MSSPIEIVRGLFPAAYAHKGGGFWNVYASKPENDGPDLPFGGLLGSGCTRAEAWETAADGLALKRRCRICGCTELQACDGGCWWVGPDLCSSCGGPPADQVQRSAEISSCGHYRYRLDRVWSDRPRALVGMLNPSKADHRQDDPTVGRLMGWFWRWGFGGFTVVNLLPLRSSNPQDALAWARQTNRGIVLERNAQVIEDAAVGAAMVLIAWGTGTHPRLHQRLLEAVRRATEAPFFCLGLAPGGTPLHPMARGKYRVPDNATPIPWRP